MLSVRDDGPGIAREQVERLFEKYGRGERFSTEGSGLGLFIVKGLVEAHGGKIRVASSVGVGTTVSVSLPISTPRSSEHERGAIDALAVPRTAAAPALF